MKTVRILPYKMTSVSARLLAQELNVLRIYPDRNTYRYKRNHLIVNWGLSVIPSCLSRVPSDCILNHPDDVAISSNKISTFNRFSQQCFYCIPDWSCDRSVAEGWLDDGDIVYCRTTVTGHGGSGIVVAKSIDEIVEAKLYTKGVANETEYRVHVFNGEIIDFVKKARRRNQDNQPSHHIRNYKQGWVFVREGVQLPQMVEEAARGAIKALGLSFGAVDVCQTTEGKACVFEVNTAPGIMNTSVERYAEAIRRCTICL